MSGWLSALAAQASTGSKPAKSVIVLWMNGGPSTIDLWDLKPGAATGGPFREIPTSVPGIQISEHLPKLARLADRLAIVRSMSTPEGDHERASFLLRRLDQNGDRQLTRNESRLPADLFQSLDRDADGRLTAAELVAWRETPPACNIVLELDEAASGGIERPTFVGSDIIVQFRTTDGQSTKTVAAACLQMREEFSAADRDLDGGDPRRDLVETLHHRRVHRNRRGRSRRDGQAKRKGAGQCKQRRGLGRFGTNHFDFRYGFLRLSSMALKTARICASSQPISTASSRASWARP